MRKMFDWLRDIIAVYVWARVAENIAPWIILYIQEGAHCGLCGKWVEGRIVEKIWAWTICEDCIKGEK